MTHRFQTLVVVLLALIQISLAPHSLAQNFALSQSSLEEVSYGTSARLLVPEALDALYEHLARLSDDTLPHDVKTPLDIRKIVLKARDYLDLFAYAMPEIELETIGKKRDGFLALRKDLDRGYEVLGAFKDLYDVQGLKNPEAARYQKKQVEEKRKAVLKWRNSFFENLPQYTAYLQYIEEHHIVIRERKHLSQFYWGASNQVPHNQESAAQNFRRLIADLLSRAATEWPDVRAIDNPAADIHNIEAFHDFRKRMRTVLKLIGYFPELMPRLNETSRAFLTGLVSRYGDISDLVAAMEIAIHEGDKSEARKLHDQTHGVWQSLQAWEDENDVLGQIEIMRRLVE